MPERTPRPTTGQAALAALLATLLVGLALPTVQAHEAVTLGCDATNAVDPDDRTAAVATGEDAVSVGLVDQLEPFDPAVLVIDAGTCVEFTNEDGLPHNVFVLADSNGHLVEQMGTNLAPGDSVAVAFHDVGTYHMNCQIHPAAMHQAIEVV